MKRKYFHAWLMLWILAGGVRCSSTSDMPPVSQTWSKQYRAVVYGTDDRMYTDDHPDTQLKKLGDAVVMLLSRSSVKTVDENTKEVLLLGSSLTKKIEASSDYNKKPLCEDEKFRLDPAPGSCTGFLIHPKRVMTAGHCIDEIDNLSAFAAQSWCNSRAVVFGFRKDRQLTTDDIYSCSRVLLHRYTTDSKATERYDIAVFELDREVKGISPLSLDWQPALNKGDPLGIIGYPHGTYQKIATDGKVYDSRKDTLDYFKSNLDTMPGNSGSPVFSINTYKVIGVHVRGERPVYQVDTDKNCNKTNVITKDVGNQSENYLRSGQLPPCQKDSDCTNTHTCEQSQCVYRTADLQIESLQLSKNTGRLEEDISVSFRIKNAGNLDITESFRIGLWRSANSDICVTCGQDQELAQQTVTGLKAGQTWDGKFVYKFQNPQQAGKQYLGIFVDDYKDSTKAVSSTGNIAELLENNNEKAAAFTLLTCTPSCTQPSALRCNQEDVEQCQLQSDGCLGWQKQKTCTLPEQCRQGVCEKTCQDQCSNPGDKRCQASTTEHCERQKSGCLDWQKVQTCSSQEICQQGVCIPRPKANGEACQSASVCASQRCWFSSGQQTGTGICTQACLQHPDCTEHTDRPYCDRDRCVALPPGQCLQSSHCATTETCREQKCQPASSPSPPTQPSHVACGCHSLPQPALSLPVYLCFGLLWLGCFFWHRRSLRITFSSH